jgi:hypothetical protein
MTQMNDGAMRNLVVEVAIELGKLRGETWQAAGGADPGQSGRGEYTLTGPGQARLALDFNVYSDDSKLTIQALYPEGTGGRIFSANVNPERGARTIAREASRRVLAAGYADELLTVLARKAEQEANQAVADAWLDQAAKLFGIDRADGHGDKLYLSDFTELRSSVQAYGPYAGGGPMKISIELNGLAPDTAMAVLRALAGSQQVHARCCYKYGPGHDTRLSLLGCLRSDRNDRKPTYAEGEALYELYRHEAHHPGDWKTWLNGTDVHPAWR